MKYTLAGTAQQPKFMLEQQMAVVVRPRPTLDPHGIFKTLFSKWPNAGDEDIGYPLACQCLRINTCALTVDRFAVVSSGRATSRARVANIKVQTAEIDT